MARTIRVAAAQTEEIIGDVPKALEIAIDLVERSKGADASLICFPEAFLQGYLCEREHVERFALSIKATEFQALLNALPENSPTIVIGFIEALANGYANSAAVIQNHRVTDCYRKTRLLANESMFTAGDRYPVFEVDALRFGVNICYDTNFPEAAWSIRDQGADLLICCANNMLSREVAEKWKDRHNPIRGERCRETGMWLLSADVTGYRDECIAWGPTSLIDPQGIVVDQLPLNIPGLLLSEITL